MAAIIITIPKNQLIALVKTEVVDHRSTVTVGATGAPYWANEIEATEKRARRTVVKIIFFIVIN
jgi:hypothetical protein